MLMLRPSGSSIWTACEAYPKMSANMPPQPESDPAREGTCAAWLAELTLTRQLETCVDGVGMMHPNGWVVDVEMAHHIQRYVNIITSRGGSIHTERHVTLNAMIAGTPDAFALLDRDGVLHVDDLKYGFGLVEAERNTQVSIYAGAILRMLTARSVVIRRVVIGIFQPRAWHPCGEYRTWSLLPEDLMQFVHWIEQQGEKCQKPNPVAIPGEHCRYCEAITTCKASANALYRTYEDACSDQQRHMSAQELSTELEFLNKIEAIIKGRKEAVEAEAEARIRSGEHVPGHHLQPRKGNRQWTMDASKIKMITGIDISKESTVTPDEAERRGMRPEVIAMLTSRPDLKPKLKKIPKGYYRNLFPK